MGSRPRLKPDFRPLRRGRGAVQLGTSAEAGGIIVAGLAPGEIALLHQLDGSHPEEALYAAAASAGVERDRATQLLDLLRTHRVLLTETGPAGGAGHEAGDGAAVTAVVPGDPAGAPDRTAEARRTQREPAPSGPGSRSGRVRRPWLVVDGAGPLTAAVAALLRAADLGRVDSGSWAADVADAELREAGPWTGGPHPALVVLVGHGALELRAGEPWRRRGIPVLPVVADGERVVVGPVVGADPALPCLRCLQLRRTDRDAVWLDVLGRPGPRPRGGVGDGLDHRAQVVELPAPSPALASAAAGVAAMVAMAALGADPVPPGVSVEVAGPWPRLDHRRWTRHPACPAHAPGSPGPVTGQVVSPVVGPVVGHVTAPVVGPVVGPGRSAGRLG